MPIQVHELQPHVCDVCRLLDRDESLKPCGYCGLCDAYICGQDMHRWSRRIRAWYKRKTEPGYKGTPDYDQKALSKEELDAIKAEGEIN